MKLFYFILSLTFSGLLGAAEKDATSPSPSDYLPVDEAFILSARYVDNSLILHWQVQPGYYLYRHGLSVGPGGALEIESPKIPEGVDKKVELGKTLQIGSPKIPDGLEKNDEFFGDVEVYYKELTLDVPVHSNPEQIKVVVGYQGCAEIGYCYLPQVRYFYFKTSESGVHRPIKSSSSSDLPL